MNDFEYVFDNVFFGEIAINDFINGQAILNFGNRPELENVLVNSITFFPSGTIAENNSGRENVNSNTNTSVFVTLANEDRFNFIDSMPWSMFFQLGAGGGGGTGVLTNFKTLRFAEPQKVSWGDSFIQVQNVGVGDILRGSINFAIDFSYA